MGRFPWIGICALLVASSAFASPLKVLQLNFNSEEVPNDSNYFVRDLRFASIVQWIKENDPDLVLIQEGWNYRTDPAIGVAIARAVGYDVAYRIGMGFPGYMLDSNALLAKKSLQMAGERDIKLPHSAPEIGDGKTWAVGFGAVTWAVGVTLTLPNGEHLYAYTSHLIGSTTQDRADQLKAIDSDLHSRVAANGDSWDKAHVILGGDFNSAPQETGPAWLVQEGYVDSFNFVHPGDTSCTDCADPSYPYFNPTTVGAGLVPNQADETDSARYDYIFSHGPGLKPLSSTLIFTVPYGGIWMSDHYGVVSTFGDESDPVVGGPVHDPDNPIAATQLLNLGNDPFLCSDSWEQNQDCASDLGSVTVDGPRGFTVQNRSDFYVEVEITGPGHILTNPEAPLNPGEAASFSFTEEGDYRYTIRNNVQSPNPYHARISGTVHVEHTGF